MSETGGYQRSHYKNYSYERAEKFHRALQHILRQLKMMTQIIILIICVYFQLHIRTYYRLFIIPIYNVSSIIYLFIEFAKYSYNYMANVKF